MPENPYQAPERFTRERAAKAPLSRRIVSAVFLTFGLIFTVASMFGFRFIADQHPKVDNAPALAALGLIAVFCYAAAYWLQR